MELDNRVFFSPKHKDHKVLKISLTTRRSAPLKKIPPLLLLRVPEQSRNSDASLDSILTDPVTDRAFHNFLMNEFSEVRFGVHFYVYGCPSPCRR